MADAGTCRAAAARTVAAVLQGRSLDTALAAESGSVSTTDRALLQELSYGACRWYHQLDALQQELLSRPLKRREELVRALLAIGLYQLRHSRVPPHAAISETVAASRLLGKGWASGLVNAVLRRCQREGDEILAGLARQRPEVELSQPRWLCRRLQAAWPSRWQQVGFALLERPPMVLRVNLARISRQEYLCRLREAGIDAVAMPAFSAALRLERPCDVAMLPGFADGLVSVQDAGAQLAAELLQPRDGERILDACAAPGGKSGHLLELAPGANLTAVDVDAERLRRVADNLQRLRGHARLEVGDAAGSDGDWSQQRYDAILADVPCSATGVIRRHPDIKLLRRDADIATLTRRQAAIIDNLWRLLAPGGRLLYATCSILPEENRDQIEGMLRRHADARWQQLSHPAVDSPDDTGSHLQLLPGAAGTDGFYYAMVRKEGR